MAYSSHNPNWTHITNSEARQLTACTVTPGEVFSYETSALPQQLQALPGLYEAYVSGYCSTYKDVSNVDVLGEIVAARSDGMGKGYAYFFGVSGTEVCFAGPYKPRDGHYYSTTDPVPVEKLFGHSPKPQEQ